MVDWINISQNSGSGNATITVTATSYSQLLERSTALTVRTATKSAVVGITQRFNSSFTVSPATISAIPYSGASYSITVTANGNWSATTIPAWCSLSANGGASGTSIITLTVSSNSGSARNDTLVFTCNGLSRSVEVSQVAEEQEAVGIAFAPSTLGFNSGGESKTLDIYCDGAWTLTAPAWLSLSQASGSGNTTITVTAQSNGGDAKSGSITGSTVNDTDICGVWQDGYYVAAGGYINEEYITFPNYLTSTTIYISSNVAWRLEQVELIDTPNVLSFSPSMGMSGTNIPVVVTLTDLSYPNQGQITLKDNTNSWANGSVMDSCVVNIADGDVYKISVLPAFVYPPSSGGSFNVSVITNGDYWTLSSTNITFSQSSGHGSTTVVATIGANPYNQQSRSWILGQIYGDEDHYGNTTNCVVIQQ